MIGLLAYYTLAIVIPALLLGHQGQDFPPRAVLRALQNRRVQPACAASQPPARRPRPVPSWAHTEPYDYEEAA